MSVSFVRELQTLFGLMITGNGMSAVSASRTERQTQRQRRKKMSKYRVTIELNERWFTILGELSKDTEGFVWEEVDKSE
jgi:uncharacterized protein YifE (UPF0438 family)